MKCTTALRRALLCASIGGLSACSDSTPEPTSNDDWANATAISMKVRTSIIVPGAGQATPMSPAPQLARLAVVRGLGPQQFAAARASGTSGGRIILKHYREPTGRTVTLAFHYDRPEAPPSFIYQFENGRIRAVVSAHYMRVRGGFVRDHSRMTFLDADGRVEFQADTKADGRTYSFDPSTRSGTFSRFTQDVLALFAPTPLYAEEEGACLQETLNYLAASAAVALATAALVTCPAQPELPQCLVGPAALWTAWTAATAKWSEALDKLVLCRQLAADAARDTTQVGSGTGGGGEDEHAWQDSLTRTAEEFIDASIAAGNYYCSADGNTCVYLAAS